MEKRYVLIFALTVVSFIGGYFFNQYLSPDENINIPINDFMINDCDNINYWKKSFGNTIKQELSYVVEGDAAISISANENGTGYYYQNTSPINLTDYHIECDLFIEDISSLDHIVFSVYSEGLTSQRYINTIKYYHPLDDGWNKLHLSKANWVYQNSDMTSWGSIQRLRLCVYATENRTVSVVFDNIHAVRDQIEGGVISLRFDDSWSSFYTEAYLRMEKYDFPGVAATITGLIEDERTNLLSISELTEMNSSGWDIISHCNSKGGRLDTKNLTEQKLELSESKLWLLEHGFTSGAEYIALPNHAWDNEIIAEVKEHYSGCMTLTGGQECIPPSDIYKIIVMPVQKDTEVEEVKSWIDDCVESDSWLILLFHNLVEDPVFYTDYDPDKFQEILDYIYEKQVPVKTLSEILNDEN